MYQKVVSCIESIRGLGKEPLSQWTLFLERLILENEKNPTVYNELLEIYNQRIQNGNDRGSHYIDYDTIQSVNLLWKKIQKNGNFYQFLLSHRNLPFFVFFTSSIEISDFLLFITSDCM